MAAQWTLYANSTMANALFLEATREKQVGGGINNVSVTSYCYYCSILLRK